ncbi:restriction endonuclease subunit S [Lactococcus lactis]|uniref:restriction endonuclease subunit S n=1 Tax=Lactococcus lactis TaxID=1358 RepID=UPI00288D8B0F|nr:restriction endonuclease subunit S [Lactococcus lactis]MDT2887442.1 restriction endonuclease subunit S [Lactococcus lactis]MDT2929982.1 restriction endonuclease subunit S [Lactococcus lactis]
MKEKLKAPELRFDGFTDDWEERKLGDLGSVAMNKRIFKEQTSDVGDIPFYKIGTFGGTPDAFISRDIFEEYKSKYQYPEVGDILISASGSIGRTVVYQGYDEYFQDSNIVWLKHDQQLDNSFLKQFYSIVKWQGLEGSTIKRLYNKNILETKITLPSPEEQQKIGSFFKQLDNTITLHQRKLDLLKEQKKGYLQKMFPKNGEKVPELRFAGFADDWEESKLGDIVVKAIDNRGKTPPTSESDKYPLLEVASIGGYYPNYSKVTKFVNYNIFNSWFRAHLKKGDILFSTVGNTGLATLMDDNQDATIAQNIVGFRAKNSNVPEFLLQMFKLPSNLKKAKRIEMGAVQPSIKVSQLIEVQYLLPKCKHEQEKIGSFFKQLDDTIALHQRKLDLLKEQKKGFLQKMFV